MELFFAPESWLFTVAVLLLLAIAILEGLALLIGLSLSGLLDHLLPDAAHGIEGVSDSWLGWLHIGKVPILVLLVILLTAFAVIGYTINSVIHGGFGFYPPAPVSAVAAFLGALPVVRMSGAAIARLIPRDETTAVSFDSLVGRMAVVVSGTARAGYPAEARVKNLHGQTLYVRVEPEGSDLAFGAGESVLLIRQIAGSRFLAISNPRPDIL
ncbi:MAG: OB-fold-containig protein [Candidatus Competibacter sp.]